jgi:hypothetical protein
MTSHVSSHPQELITFLDTSYPQVLVEPEAPEVLRRLQEEGVTCIGYALSASKGEYHANQDWWIAECARNGLMFSEVEIPYYSWLCRHGIYLAPPYGVRTRDFPISLLLPPQRFLRHTVVFLSRSEVACHYFINAGRQKNVRCCCVLHKGKGRGKVPLSSQEVFREFVRFKRGELAH